jgi:hypothetical protein
MICTWCSQMLTKLQSFIKTQSPFDYHPGTILIENQNMYKGMMEIDTN